jgi:hypothetical protein
LSETNDAADFAAALNQAAEAAEESPDAHSENASDGDTDVSTANESESPEASSAPGSDDSSDGDESDGPEEDSEADGPVSDNVAGIRQKFIDGDIEAALKDLGVDPKVLGVNGPKLIAMRRGLKEAKELTATANAKLAKAVESEESAKAIIADGRKTYGHLVDLKNALKLGEFTAARDILEALAPEGTTYKQIAEGLAKAAAGMSPSEVIYRKKLRELAEKERQEAEAAEAAKAKAKEPAPEVVAQKNLDGAKKLLAKTTFADIPGAAEKLVELAAKNWDPVKKGLKVPKEQLVKDLEKDPVISQLLELKKLKAKGKPAAEAPVEREKATGKFRSRRTPVADPSAKERDEFAAAMAEASRMEAAERRRLATGKGRR